MDAESKITPWKTILDGLRGVQGVWDQKMSKNFKVAIEYYIMCTDEIAIKSWAVLIWRQHSRMHLKIGYLANAMSYPLDF